MTPRTDTAAQGKAPAGTCSNAGTKSSQSNPQASPARSGAATAGTPPASWAVLEYEESCGNTKLGSRFKITRDGTEVGEMHDRESALALVAIFELWEKSFN